MNAVRDWTDLPFIEPTPAGCWPDRRITAPCTRDDGVKSHRDYTPLKSLKLNTPGDSRQRNDEYERDAMLDGATPSTDNYDYFEEIGYGH